MFTKLLVPLDRSALAEQALRPAAAIARAASAPVELVLVHEPHRFTDDGQPPAASSDARHPPAPTAREVEERYLDGAVAMLGADGVRPHSTVATGRPAETICARAAAVGADLIVMTSHGRTGLSRAWLGSVADDVVRHSHIPVLMLRPTVTGPGARAPREIRRMLVPLDDSPESATILETAADFARLMAAAVTLVHVVEPVPSVSSEFGFPVSATTGLLDDAATSRLTAGAAMWLEWAAARLRDAGLSDVTTHVLVHGSPAESITALAHAGGFDVIAMATHGRGASRLLIGSVTDKVRRSCDIPLLLQCPPRASGAASSIEQANDVLASLPPVAAV